MIAPIDLLSAESILDRVLAAIEDPAVDRAIRRLLQELEVKGGGNRDINRSRGVMIGYVSALWYETEGPGSTGDAQA